MMDGGSTTPGRNPQLLRLSALLELEQRARALPAPELGYLMVNDTLTILPYQQAAFWRDGRVAAVSGVAAAETGGPYHRWLAATLAAIAASPQARAMHVVDPAARGAPAADWAEWFPPEALWCPLIDRRQVLLGGLLFGRHDPWLEGERNLLGLLAGTYALSLAADELRPRRPWRHIGRRRLVWIAAGIAAAAASMVPVRSSVLAPADVVAAAPFPIRAPFDGVVDAIDVAPDARVKRGQLLLSFDTNARRAQADVAAKALQIAQAEYSEAAQQAFTNTQAKGQVSILQAKVAQAEAELAYDRSMLARATVTAPIDGVAVFDDPQQWLGRPAQLGERIMVVAPPRSTHLDIHVPVAQVVTFAKGSEVVFFPNIDPEHPVHGTLTYAGYDSSVGPDGVMAYVFRARLVAASQGLRLGLKGTAKIFGPRRPFLLWVLRRPLAAVRAWLSF